MKLCDNTGRRTECRLLQRLTVLVQGVVDDRECLRSHAMQHGEFDSGDACEVAPNVPPCLAEDSEDTEGHLVWQSAG
jgi:hypothetical protein